MTEIRTLVGVKEFVETRFQREKREVPTLIASVTAIARIDDGRWIVDCPSDLCRGAMMVDKDDLRVFCFSCYNEYCNGQWIHVQLPVGWENVEKSLKDLPHWEQFWRQD